MPKKKETQLAKVRRLQRCVHETHRRNEELWRENITLIEEVRHLKEINHVVSTRNSTIDDHLNSLSRGLDATSHALVALTDRIKA